ncbi:hypothetical protein OSB04_008424 [Centaurea solstitialis]|uniref:Heme O synthase n=1 Tax=Centaurea solstitialis TaxID=347529 RepID=A0AA38TLT6_9ASTR|nr:hypothetical protein OSB04_008424 [Centaurea solstitialis]
MWRRRNSLSHFTQLATSSSSKFNFHHLNLQSPSIRLLQTLDVDHGYGLLTRSSSSTAVGPPSNSGVDRVRAFGSTAGVVDTTTLGPREVIDMARHYGRCYWELSKAKLSMLVVATSGAGYVLGSGSTVDLAGLCYTCAGTMMVAASANTLNQVFEVKNDALMNRTMRRPLPSGRLTFLMHHMGFFCWSCWHSSTCKQAGLGASNLILYAFVYTPLKQIHPVNTWVGAVVGAFLLFSGGLQLPVRFHSMDGSFLLPCIFGKYRILWLLHIYAETTTQLEGGITSGWFCLESTLLALAISGTAVSFLQNRTKASARRMFHASLLYLPVFMSGLMFHRIYDDDRQKLETENTKDNMVVSRTTTAYEQDSRNPDRAKHAHSRPPVAYASVAPFPFLPAPIYSSS